MWWIFILCLVAGLGCLGKYFYERKKQKEEKGFVVILGAVLLIWLFPGLALLLLALVVLLFVLGLG